MKKTNLENNSENNTNELTKTQLQPQELAVRPTIWAEDGDLLAMFVILTRNIGDFKLNVGDFMWDVGEILEIIWVDIEGWKSEKHNCQNYKNVCENASWLLTTHDLLINTPETHIFGHTFYILLAAQNH